MIHGFRILYYPKGESLDDLDFLGLCKDSILNANSGRWIEDDLPFPRDDFEVPGDYKTHLGGGFKYFLFSPLLGEDSHFD